MWWQTRDVLYCAGPCCVSMYMSVSQLLPCTHLSLLLFSLPINMPKKFYLQMFSTQSCGWGMTEDLATTWESVLFADRVSVIMQLDVWRRGWIKRAGAGGKQVETLFAHTGYLQVGLQRGGKLSKNPWKIPKNPGKFPIFLNVSRNLL